MEYQDTWIYDVDIKKSYLMENLQDTWIYDVDIKESYLMEYQDTWIYDVDIKESYLMAVYIFIVMDSLSLT